MTEDSQKKLRPVRPDLADQARSPTSTTDATLGRFLRMTARWKALIGLETARPITVSVAVVDLGVFGRFRADQGSRQREIFCRQSGLSRPLI